MEKLAYPLLILVVGLYFAYRNIRLLRDEKTLRDYMMNSPKAAMWVKKYGLERATEMTRTTFLPIGIAVSVALAGMGAWLLWRIYG